MCGWTLPEAKFKSNDRAMERGVTRKKGARHDELNSVLTVRVRGMVVPGSCMETWARWGEKDTCVDLTNCPTEFLTCRGSSDHVWGPPSFLECRARELSTSYFTPHSTHTHAF